MANDPVSISANRTYSAIRHDLKSQDPKGKKDSIRFTEGKQLYVKKRITNWFGNLINRSNKYKAAANKIKQSINLEFKGTTVNGQQIGDLVFARLGNPIALKVKSFDDIDKEIAKALKESVVGNKPDAVVNMATDAADMFDGAADAGHVGGLKLKGWGKRVSGVQQLRNAIVADLKAARPEMYNVGGDVIAKAAAESILEDAGVSGSSGLTANSMTKVANAMKNNNYLGNARPNHVMGLVHLLNNGMKIQQTGSQLVASNAKLDRILKSSQELKLDNFVVQKTNELRTNSANMVGRFHAHVRTSEIKGEIEAVDIYNGLAANASLATKLANSLPHTHEQMLSHKGYTQKDYDELPQILKDDFDKELVESKALKNTLQDHAAQSHDLAMSLVPMENRGLDRRPVFSHNSDLNQPSGLHQVSFDGLKDQAVVPQGIYNSGKSGDVAAKRTLAFFATEYNKAMVKVDSCLKKFQQAPTDANLANLAGALEEASIANDYLVARYSTASGRYALKSHHRNGNFSRGQNDWMLGQINQAKTKAIAQRREIQDLKLMVTRANDQRSYMGDLNKMNPKDLAAKQIRNSNVLAAKPLPPFVPPAMDVNQTRGRGDSISSDASDNQNGLIDPNRVTMQADFEFGDAPAPAYSEMSEKEKLNIYNKFFNPGLGAEPGMPLNAGNIPGVDHNVDDIGSHRSSQVQKITIGGNNDKDDIFTERHAGELYDDNDGEDDVSVIKNAKKDPNYELPPNPYIDDQTNNKDVKDDEFVVKTKEGLGNAGGYVNDEDMDVDEGFHGDALNQTAGGGNVGPKQNFSQVNLEALDGFRLNLKVIEKKAADVNGANTDVDDLIDLLDEAVHRGNFRPGAILEEVEILRSFVNVAAERAEMNDDNDLRETSKTVNNLLDQVENEVRQWMDENNIKYDNDDQSIVSDGSLTKDYIGNDKLNEDEMNLINRNLYDEDELDNINNDIDENENEYDDGDVNVDDIDDGLITKDGALSDIDDELDDIEPVKVTIGGLANDEEELYGVNENDLIETIGGGNDNDHSDVASVKNAKASGLNMNADQMDTVSQGTEMLIALQNQYGLDTGHALNLIKPMWKQVDYNVQPLIIEITQLMLNGNKETLEPLRLFKKDLEDML